MHAEGVGLLSDELIDLLGRLLAGSQSRPPERHVESLLRELRADPTLHRPLNLRAHVQHAMKNETHMTVRAYCNRPNQLVLEIAVTEGSCIAGTSVMYS
jgi:hypothetical protein